jgi:hypothetical protein
MAPARGDADVSRLFEMSRAGWTTGLVQRAAIAAVAEPRLLKTSEAASMAVEIVDQ